jgi:adenosylhomocysteine nucleosidase
MIVLLAALEEEVSGLKQRMALAPEAASGLDDAAYTGQFRGKPVALVVTGMGRQRAEASIAAVLARLPVTAVISTGFSGALERQLQIADLVLASELMGLAGPGSDEIEPIIYQADQRLLHTTTEALRTTSLRVVSGPTVTAPSIIATPAGKQGMGRQTGAVAVDMESYWVARAISDRCLPFLAIRAISDAQEELLPPLHQILDEEGNPRARRLAAHLIREPGSLVALARLARNARQARQALTAGVACTVAAL